jgi:hypothetical protein
MLGAEVEPWSERVFWRKDDTLTGDGFLDGLATETAELFD